MIAFGENKSTIWPCLARLFRFLRRLLTNYSDGGGCFQRFSDLNDCSFSWFISVY